MIHFLGESIQNCIRSRRGSLDPAHPRRRPAAGEIADRDGMGRRARAARRGRVAFRPHPADGAVRHQRAPRAHERVPPRPRRLARKRHARPPQPLSPHPQRHAPLRRRLSPHLRAPRGRLARRVGARARGRRTGGAARHAARRARVGRLRRVWRRSLRAPARVRPHAAVDPGCERHRELRGRGARRRPRGPAPDRRGRRQGVGPGRARHGLSSLPCAIRRRDRALPRRPRARSRAVLRRAHAAHPCLSPRAPARPAPACLAAAARLARVRPPMRYAGTSIASPTVSPSATSRRRLPSPAPERPHRGRPRAIRSTRGSEDSGNPRQTANSPTMHACRARSLRRSASPSRAGRAPPPSRVISWPMSPSTG